MKKLLIQQSLAPLFLLILIKNFDISAINETYLYIASCIRDYTNILSFSSNITLSIILTICLFAVIKGLVAYVKLPYAERYNFSSSGQKIKIIGYTTNESMTFFSAYIMPMILDLENYNNQCVFIILVFLLRILLSKTNMFYANPILTILGYSSFRFTYTHKKMIDTNNFIGLTRGFFDSNRIIKSKQISEKVFLIFNE